jgi:hypothetical protein
MLDCHRRFGVYGQNARAEIYTRGVYNIPGKCLKKHRTCHDQLRAVSILLPYERMHSRARTEAMLCYGLPLGPLLSRGKVAKHHNARRASYLE